MQNNQPKLEDIAIPETVEVAIMKWWNSPQNFMLRESDIPESCLAGVIEAVKVALHSLACDAVVPSVSQAVEMENEGQLEMSNRGWYLSQKHAVQWQRRMFLRKADLVPEEVKAFLLKDAAGTAIKPAPGSPNDRILKAFAFGKEARDAK